MSEKIKINGQLSKELQCDICEQFIGVGKKSEISCSPEELAGQLTEEDLTTIAGKKYIHFLKLAPSQEYCSCEKPQTVPNHQTPFQAGHRENFCYHYYKPLLRPEHEIEEKKEFIKKIGEWLNEVEARIKILETKFFT